MISIIIKCDNTGIEFNLTEEYGVTSLKQAYYMLMNGEIDNWKVKKDGDEYKHYFKKE